MISALEAKTEFIQYKRKHSPMFFEELSKIEDDLKDLIEMSAKSGKLYLNFSMTNVYTKYGVNVHDAEVIINNELSYLYDLGYKLSYTYFDMNDSIRVKLSWE